MWTNLNIFAATFFILLIWQFNTFFIRTFYTVIFVFLKVIFAILVALISNMYTKRICIIELFIHFMFNTSMNFLSVIFSLVYCFMFSFSFHGTAFMYVFYSVIHHHVLFLFIFILLLTKMLITFKIMVTPRLMIYG